jgi:hypothetical protein
MIKKVPFNPTNPGEWLTKAILRWGLIQKIARQERVKRLKVMSPGELLSLRNEIIGELEKDGGRTGEVFVRGEEAADDIINFKGDSR